MPNRNQNMNFFGAPMNSPSNTRGMGGIPASGNDNFMDFMRSLESFGGPNSSVVQNTGGAAPTTDNFMSGVMPGGGGGDGSGMREFLFGDGDGAGGAAMPMISLGKGIFDGYLGMKQVGLAKDQLRENKSQFEKNFDNQVQTTNTQLRDRQRRRHHERSDVHASPDEYMKENRVGG